MSLWLSYTLTFLAAPECQGDREIQTCFKVLSLFAFPAGTHGVLKRLADTSSVWSFKVCVKSLAVIVVHLHNDDDLLCVRYWRCVDGYRVVFPYGGTVLVADWNRYYTLTRGSDAQCKPELRPWAVVERI